MLTDQGGIRGQFGLVPQPFLLFLDFIELRFQGLAAFAQFPPVGLQLHDRVAGAGEFRVGRVRRFGRLDRFGLILPVAGGGFPLLRRHLAQVVGVADVAVGVLVFVKLSICGADGQGHQQDRGQREHAEKGAHGRTPFDLGRLGGTFHDGQTIASPWAGLNIYLFFRRKCQIFPAVPQLPLETAARIFRFRV